jgi:heme/copper-type cytochrome/quinol oxidase subunit 4
MIFLPFLMIAVLQDFLLYATSVAYDPVALSHFLHLKQKEESSLEAWMLADTVVILELVVTSLF